MRAQIQSKSRPKHATLTVMPCMGCLLAAPNDLVFSTSELRASALAAGDSDMSLLLARWSSKVMVYTHRGTGGSARD